MTHWLFLNFPDLFGHWNSCHLQPISLMLVDRIYKSTEFCHSMSYGYLTTLTFCKNFIIMVLFLERGRGPKKTEHENWPIFLTEFGKFVRILTGFGNRNHGEHEHFYFERFPLDILKWFERKSEISPFGNPTPYFVECCFYQSNKSKDNLQKSDNILHIIGWKPQAA